MIPVLPIDIFGANSCSLSWLFKSTAVAVAVAVVKREIEFQEMKRPLKNGQTDTNGCKLNFKNLK